MGEMQPLALAERIARRAHEGQKCTVTGEPYIRHVERVASMVDGDEAKAVAWLHDVLEDAPLTELGLEIAGIPTPVIEAVRLLTRSEPYESVPYIDKLYDSRNRLAIAVKLADLRDHLTPTCPERLRPRYEAAFARLSKLYAALDGVATEGQEVI